MVDPTCDNNDEFLRCADAILLADALRFITAAARRGVVFELGDRGSIVLAGPSRWLDVVTPQVRARHAEFVAALRHTSNG